MKEKMHSTFHRSFWGVSLLAMLTLVLAACQPSATASPTMAPAVMATTAPTIVVAQPGQEAVVSVVTDPKLGKILVDAKGMTLYAFTKDVADKSNCSGGCLKAWPALLSLGSPKAGTGVDQTMLGTATMADGTKIVTYNHMPLYNWAKDQKPGDVTGQNVSNVWFVVSPDGKMVTSEITVPATGGTPSTTTPGAMSSSQVMLNVATDPKLGKILVDGKGMTLYIFTKDTADKSNCTGGCLKAWPPFIALGNVTTGDGVDKSMLGTAALADGTKIVTYNHMPLYYWAGDTKPGDTAGQSVSNVWFVITPAGKPVQPGG